MFESQETIQLISRRSDDEAINLDRRAAISLGCFFAKHDQQQEGNQKNNYCVGRGKTLAL